MRHVLPALGLAILAAASAGAQTNRATSNPVPIGGNVPLLCAVSPPATGDNSFALGTLVDEGTGLLLPGLAAPPKTLAASFCSARSTIAVVATPMVALNYTTVPPDGFSRSVDFVATASGWTTTPASFATAAASNPNAAQIRPTPFQGDIVVAVSNFTTTGGDQLRLVSDPQYRGTVTVTLTAAN